MHRIGIPLMILLLGTLVEVSTVNAQIPDIRDARGLLIELRDILAQASETEEECQALLESIKLWQERKLEEIESLETMIVIIEPRDGDLVPNRPYIEGIVIDPEFEVAIIVHPMEVSDYWVQPIPSVKRDGTWKASIYVGRPGGIDAGKHFEIMAVADSEKQLKEGDILTSWPEARWKSEIIEVIRK
jgi:hypothetical protein